MNTTIRGGLSAESLYRRAIEGKEQMLGKNHPNTLTSMNTLSLLYKNKRDYGAAEPLYRRALGGSERVLGKGHPDTLTSVNNLALLLDSKGDYEAAEPLFRVGRSLGCLTYAALWGKSTRILRCFIKIGLTVSRPLGWRRPK